MTELFGTNGIRGEINERMTSQLALDLGKAMGTWIGKDSKVAIGTDTRVSNDMLKSAVSSGLMTTGCDVIDLGELPTPAIQHYTRKKADLGVVITASHNPPKFNGIKCIYSDGTELIEHMEKEIEKIYFSKDFDLVDWKAVGKMKEDEAITNYKESIKEKIDYEVIREAKPKVILDCANGAGCFVTPYLLKDLGCEVVTLNAQPDGTFPGHESEPTEENLKDLIKITKESDADLGIAHDGDADRTICIDENGDYIYGDRILALVAKELVQKNDGGIVVTPIASSTCVRDVVEANGGELIYTKVGSPIVARKMKEKEALFGGEENGGLIFAEHQYCRDAAMTAAKVVELIAKKGKLSEMIDELPTYHLVKKSFRCQDELKDQVLDKLKILYRDENFDDTDGLKLYYDRGWVLIRPSGTEPKYRVYSESSDRETAEKLAEKHLEQAIEVMDSI